MTEIIVIYIIVSIIIGLWDFSELRAQEDYIAQIPIGDLNYYNPYSIIGIHNFIFLPSLILIGGWMIICMITNKIIDG